MSAATPPAQERGAFLHKLAGAPLFPSDKQAFSEGINPAQAAGFMHDPGLPFPLPLCYTGSIAIRNDTKQIRNDLRIVSNAVPLWHKEEAG